MQSLWLLSRMRVTSGLREKCFLNFTVRASPRLREKCQFLRFARKRQPLDSFWLPYTKSPDEIRSQLQIIRACSLRNSFFLIIFINQYQLNPKSAFGETNPFKKFLNVMYESDVFFSNTSQKAVPKSVPKRFPRRLSGRGQVRLRTLKL